jgi:hypothetical protein
VFNTSRRVGGARAVADFMSGVRLSLSIAAGVGHAVTFEPALEAEAETIDSGYRSKYGRSSHVDAMVTRPRLQRRCA